jgi:hypothetical protein
MFLLLAQVMLQITKLKPHFLISYIIFYMQKVNNLVMDGNVQNRGNVVMFILSLLDLLQKNFGLIGIQVLFLFLL